MKLVLETKNEMKKITIKQISKTNNKRIHVLNCNLMSIGGIKPKSKQLVWEPKNASKCQLSTELNPNPTTSENFEKLF